MINLFVLFRRFRKKSFSGKKNRRQRASTARVQLVGGWFKKSETKAAAKFHPSSDNECVGTQPSFNPKVRFGPRPRLASQPFELFLGKIQPSLFSKVAGLGGNYIPFPRAGSKGTKY